MRNAIYKNLPNIVSILGFAPIGLLLLEDGYRFLIPLIIFNNVMDDLDGLLAARLDLKSSLGAILDNVCDLVAHTLFVLVVGMHFGGGVRSRQRRRDRGRHASGGGSFEQPDGSRKRVADQRGSCATCCFCCWPRGCWISIQPPFLVAIFLLHSVSMLVPFSMPHMIRSRGTIGFSSLPRERGARYCLAGASDDVVNRRRLCVLLFVFAGCGRRWPVTKIVEPIREGRKRIQTLGFLETAAANHLPM